MFVVSDVERSRDWYTGVLDAQVFGDYGGDSVILELLGNWILLVSGGGPDAGKPGVTLAPPRQRDQPSAQLIFRVEDCMGLHELLASRGAEFLAVALLQLATRKFPAATEMAALLSLTDKNFTLVVYNCSNRNVNEGLIH